MNQIFQHLQPRREQWWQQAQIIPNLRAGRSLLLKTASSSAAASICYPPGPQQARPHTLLILARKDRWTRRNRRPVGLAARRAHHLAGFPAGGKLFRCSYCHAWRWKAPVAQCTHPRARGGKGHWRECAGNPPLLELTVSSFLCLRGTNRGRETLPHEAGLDKSLWAGDQAVVYRLLGPNTAVVTHSSRKRIHRNYERQSTRRSSIPPWVKAPAPLSRYNEIIEIVALTTF